MALKSKTLSFLSMLFALALLATVTFAQETPPAPPSAEKTDKTFKRDKMARKTFGPRHGKRGGLFLRGLDLTDAQKSQIMSIREANRPDPTVVAELKAIRDAHKAGQQLTDEQKTRIKSFREQTRTKANAMREQIVAVLTAEQKAKLDARRTKMEERFRNRRLERNKKPGFPAIDKPKTI